MSESDDALTMHGVERKGQELTLIELALRLEGDIRRRLQPIRVTLLQAGVLLFLRRQGEATVTVTAAALGVRLSTLSTVVRGLACKRWITKHRSVTDTRIVHLRPSRLGRVIIGKVENQVQQVQANKVLTAAGLKRAKPHSSST